MPLTRLHDKHEIEQFLRQDTQWKASSQTPMPSTRTDCIATHPDHRGLGYGKAVTARICRSLLQTVDEIGLNVKADNCAAITCYERFGFETVAEYAEFFVQM